MIDNAPAIKRLVLEANKAAQTHDCSVKQAGPFIRISYKRKKNLNTEFDIRIEEIKDPLGRQLMSIKVAGQEERYRAYATADGSILFGMMYAWD